MENGFNEFLKTNSWWIALVFVGLIVLSVALIYLSGIRKKAVAPVKAIDKNAYLSALGGADNVLDKKLVGSRIVLVLKDHKKIDRAKLKEAGVDSFVEMSDKLTLVIKGGAAKVYKTLFD